LGSISFFFEEFSTLISVLSSTLLLIHWTFEIK